MAELLGLETGVNAPSFSNFFSNIGLGISSTTMYILIILLIAGVLGVIAFLIYQKRVYRIKIQYYENLGGNRFIEAGHDVARVIRLGVVDGELLYAKRKKMYLPADGLRMGLNKFYFAKNNEDGYWYNITLGDLDAKAGVLDIEPTDRDMKATAYAIRKNTELRHSKKSSWKDVLPYVIPGILLLILVFGGWWLIKKTGDYTTQVSTATAENMRINERIAETNKVIVTKLDMIMAESGIKQIPT